MESLHDRPTHPNVGGIPRAWGSQMERAESETKTISGSWKSWDVLWVSEINHVDWKATVKPILSSQESARRGSLLLAGCLLCGLKMDRPRYVYNVSNIRSTELSNKGHRYEGSESDATLCFCALLEYQDTYYTHLLLTKCFMRGQTAPRSRSVKPM